jgi:hypothetical protein
VAVGVFGSARDILERIPADGGEVEIEESGEEWAELGIEWVLVGDDENESRLLAPLRRLDSPVAADNGVVDLNVVASLVALLAVEVVDLKGVRVVGLSRGMVAFAISL